MVWIRCWGAAGGGSRMQEIVANHPLPSPRLFPDDKWSQQHILTSYAFLSIQTRNNCTTKYSRLRFEFICLIIFKITATWKCKYSELLLKYFSKFKTTNMNGIRAVTHIIHLILTSCIPETTRVFHKKLLLQLQLWNVDVKDQSHWKTKIFSIVKRFTWTNWTKIF